MMNDWTKEPPNEEGDYLMRDEGGGPTLYQAEIIDGELLIGVKHKKWRIDTDSFPDSEWQRVD